MTDLSKVVEFLDKYLDIKKIKDDSYNGLQIAGKPQVNKVLFAVDAGMQTFEKAVEHNADMVVVHHGMFWKSARPCVTGFNKERVEFLLKHDISLYAAHLPLDKHSEVGNNAQLIKILGFEIDKPFGFYNGDTISFIGKSDAPKTIQQIEDVLTTQLGAQCKTLAFGKKEISTIAVCSGGGAYPQFMEAIDAQVDLYLTGDSTEMYHLAKDIGINVIFGGHHATETVGVKALAGVVEEEFGIKTVFVDIPTGL